MPRGPTSLATSSMLSGPPHDVYLVSFLFVFVSIMFEYHQIMMTRRDSLRHLATSPPPGLMPLVPCNITEGFSYSSQSFVQFMFFHVFFKVIIFVFYFLHWSHFDSFQEGVCEDKEDFQSCEDLSIVHIAAAALDGLRLASLKMTY